MSVKLTLQINSLPALEEIMKGSDTEVSIEVRQAVAVAFAEKWLKPIADNPLFEKAVRELNTEIHRSLDEFTAKAIGNISRYSEGQISRIELNQDWKDHIRSMVKELIGKEVLDAVRQAYVDREKQIKESLDALNIPDMVDKLTAVATAEATNQILAKLKH